MDKFSWIKDLVAADRRQESGVIDIAENELALQLEDTSVDFLHDLKLEFLKVTSAFNQLNNSSVGPVKVYSIAKTKADFMLFRNGAKLVFSLQNGGGIIVSHQMGITGDETLSQHVLMPEPVNFGQLRWMYKGHPVEKDYLLRFYMSQFVKASAEVRNASQSIEEMP